MTTHLVPGAGVLLTAPHAVEHARLVSPSAERERKPADRGTGQLAEAVARGTGAGALVARAPWPGDANADAGVECPFKKAVLGLLEEGFHTVIDLHGMHAGHGMDVCIGTGGTSPGRAAETIAACLRDVGLSTSFNTPYAGKGPGTVRTAAANAGADAVQLELAPALRDPYAHLDQTRRVAAALDAAVRSLR